MINRVLINIFLSFLIMPLLKLGMDFIKFEINGDHSMYSGSFLEYEKLIWTTVFLIAPLVFIIFVLLPYNMVLLKYRIRNLILKIVTFESIMLLEFFLAGLFINIWVSPVWKNFYAIFYFLPISVIFASLIHFFVDRRIHSSATKDNIV